MVEHINILMASGHWAEAKAASQKVIFEHPTCASAHAYLGLCLFHERKWQEAYVEFERATLLDPHYWQAGFKMAECLDKMQQYNKAYEVALEWQRVNPNDSHLNHFIHGLIPFLQEEITEGWQIAKHGQPHNVTLTH